MTKCLYAQPKATSKIISYKAAAVDRWLTRGFKPKSIKQANGKTYLYGEFKNQDAFLSFNLNPRRDGVFTQETRFLAQLMQLVGENSDQAYVTCARL